MKINLIINYFVHQNSVRQEEINFSLKKNLSNTKIDNYLLIVSDNDYEKLKNVVNNDIRVKYVIDNNRPTYNDYFKYINKEFGGLENLNILSNVDIIFTKNSITEIFKNVKEKNTCLALTRYEIQDINNIEEKSIFCGREDSQDCWIFKGDIKEIKEANYTMGVSGCDNSIAFLLEKNGYSVKNPSKTVKTYHLHKSGVRSYPYRVPRPYKLLPPTE